MSAPRNSFKSALAKGDMLYGCWAGFADPYPTEVLATAGFDWLAIDAELLCHVNIDPPSQFGELAKRNVLLQ